VSVHGSPSLYFEPIKLLNFELKADPDPALNYDVDKD
jgi:hypothetical protein